MLDRTRNAVAPAPHDARPRAMFAAAIDHRRTEEDPATPCRCLRWMPVKSDRRRCCRRWPMDAVNHRMRAGASHSACARLAAPTVAAAARESRRSGLKSMPTVAIRAAFTSMSRYPPIKTDPGALLDLRHAGAIPIRLTALQGSDDAWLKKGETIIIHGASEAGTLAIQFEASRCARCLQRPRARKVSNWWWRWVRMRPSTANAPSISTIRYAGSHPTASMPCWRLPVETRWSDA